MIFLMSIIFFVIAFMGKRNLKKSECEERDYQCTIDRVIFSDTGNVEYYVVFEENAHTIMTQTEHYSSKTPSLHPHEKVKIKYFFTKNKVPRAIIIDERVKSVSFSVPKIFNFCILIGILLFLTALFVFMQIVQMRYIIFFIV